MKKAVIYQIINITNSKLYIGSTTNYSRRKYKHLVDLRKGNHHCRKLQNSFKKHGESKFVFSSLEVFEYSTKQDILDKEQYYLDNLKPYYNSSPTAGSCLGVKHSEEFKKVVSDRVRKKREKALDLIRKGYSTSKICKVLNIARSAVADAREELKEKEGISFGVVTKRVIDTNTNIIYDNAVDAAKAIGMSEVTLRKQLNGIHPNKTTLSYYHDEYRTQSLEVAKNQKTKCKVVLQYDSEGRFIQEYPSTVAASKATGYSQSNISNCCTGKPSYNLIKGFIFKYKTNDEKI